MHCRVYNVNGDMNLQKKIQQTIFNNSRENLIFPLQLFCIPCSTDRRMEDKTAEWTEILIIE